MPGKELKELVHKEVEQLPHERLQSWHLYGGCATEGVLPSEIRESTGKPEAEDA